MSVVVWCLIGGIAGDALSFWLGRRLGVMTTRQPWMRGQRRGIARTRLFFRRHSVMTLAFYRFTVPVRAFVPLSRA